MLQTGELVPGAPAGDAGQEGGEAADLLVKLQPAQSVEGTLGHRLLQLRGHLARQDVHKTVKICLRQRLLERLEQGVDVDDGLLDPWVVGGVVAKHLLGEVVAHLAEAVYPRLQPRPHHAGPESREARVEAGAQLRGHGAEPRHAGAQLVRLLGADGGGGLEAGQLSAICNKYKYCGGSNKGNI